MIAFFRLKIITLTQPKQVFEGAGITQYLDNPAAYDLTLRSAVVAVLGGHLTNVVVVDVNAITSASSPSMPAATTAVTLSSLDHKLLAAESLQVHYVYATADPSLTTDSVTGGLMTSIALRAVLGSNSHNQFDSTLHAFATNNTGPGFLTASTVSINVTDLHPQSTGFAPSDPSTRHSSSFSAIAGSPLLLSAINITLFFVVGLALVTLARMILYSKEKSRQSILLSLSSSSDSFDGDALLVRDGELYCETQRIALVPDIEQRPTPRRTPRRTPRKSRRGKTVKFG